MNVTTILRLSVGFGNFKRTLERNTGYDQYKLDELDPKYCLTKKFTYVFAYARKDD